MIYKNVNSTFPSQVVSDAEKQSLEYGHAVGRAIENEWFRGDRGAGAGGRFGNNWQSFHRLRLYARGEQSVQKYKDEMSINGDLSYLNLDWQPVAVLSKFVDIVVNGMNDRLFKIKATAQDAMSAEKRNQFQEMIQSDMIAKPLLQQINTDFGVDAFQTSEDELPENDQELELFMQMNYKPAIEIAEDLMTIFPRNLELNGVRLDKYGSIAPSFFSDSWSVTPVSFEYQQVID